MTDDKTIPDAEVVAEDKDVAAERPPEVITVIHPSDDEEPPDEAAALDGTNEVRVRVTARSRHRLEVRIFEVDEDGYIDIVILDADTN